MPHRNSMQTVPFYSDECIPWKPLGGERVFPNSVFQPSGFRGYRIFKTSFLSLGHHGIDSLTLSESGHLVFIKFQ
ncbi:hypothetical protein BDN67DRAFT_965953 [Paxillus ammoniavirescens]|nr:hypothetical protein BDN67DRAFT_965953 [Paxillus ammoniavirescens]